MTTISAVNSSAKGRVTPEEKAHIRALRSAGHSISEICERTGRVRSAVHRHIKGVRLPNGPLKRGPKGHVAKRAVAIRLYREGLTYDAIAARLKVSKSTVYYAVKGRAA